MWNYYLHWVVAVVIVTADHFNKLESVVTTLETKIGLVEYEISDSTGIVLPDTINIPPFYKDPNNTVIDTSITER